MEDLVKEFKKVRLEILTVKGINLRVIKLCCNNPKNSTSSSQNLEHKKEVKINIGKMFVY